MESIQSTTDKQEVHQEVHQEEQFDNDGFTKVNKVKKQKHLVISKLSLQNFQKLFSNKVITYYNKNGKKNEFDNFGVIKRTVEEVKDKNGNTILNEAGLPRTRYTVYMNTYISLMGDVVMVTWDNEEVSFYTKIGHPDLQNWGRKMYWKVD